MSCPICNKIKNKKDLIIYEDDTLIGFLEETPASYGHITLTPKQHLPIFENYDDNLISHIFNTANKISSVLFDSLNIQGTNLLINNGVAAGQKYPHFLLHIIPRTENDNLQLEWEPKKISEDEMNSAEQQLKSAASNVVVVKEKKTEVVKDQETEILETKDDEENYLIKHLRRIP